MLVVGLTGNFGTGKSTVAGMFARRGALVISADEVTRSLLSPGKKCWKKVAKIFSGVILTNGEVNRSKLATVVFQDSRALKKLTDILYPEALKEIKKQVFLNKHKKLIVLDVPLLFESGWEKIADITIVVYANRRQQIQRLQQRMPITKSEILRRLRLQMPMRVKLQRADIVIDNRGGLPQTRQQVVKIMDRLSRMK